MQHFHISQTFDIYLVKLCSLIIPNTTIFEPRKICKSIQIYLVAFSRYNFQKRVRERGESERYAKIPNDISLTARLAALFCPSVKVSLGKTPSPRSHKDSLIETRRKENHCFPTVWSACSALLSYHMFLAVSERALKLKYSQLSSARRGSCRGVF